MGNELLAQVEELRALRKEGIYWDFKREWPDNGSLLHDIICLANNTDFRDGLIVIGVDEETDYSFCDIKNDRSRKNTQNMVDFLRDKPFAGGIRPTVIVSQIVVDSEITIDVITVKSTRSVPFYLSKDCRTEGKNLRCGCIYTRAQDTNTPINKTADRYLVERLWNHHFALDATPIERFGSYLANRGKWVCSPEDTGSILEYYKPSPEFTIERIPNYSNAKPAYYHCLMCNQAPNWHTVKLRYHQTVMESRQATFLDSGNCFTITPQPGFLRVDPKDTERSHRHVYKYGYFIEGSLEWLLHTYFQQNETPEQELVHEAFISEVVVYQSVAEKEAIETTIQSDHYGLEEKIQTVNTKPFENCGQGEMEQRQFEESLKAVRVIQDELEKTRKLTYQNKLFA